MRRVTLMLAAVAVMVSLFAAVAYAATIEGTDKGEALFESDRNDTIFGRGGPDRIIAGFFTDDRDVAYGNAGRDQINTEDSDGRDTLNGGKGGDICFGDPNDQFISCEDSNEEVGGGGRP